MSGSEIILTAVRFRRAPTEEDGSEGQNEMWAGQIRAILRCTLVDGSTPLPCLVRWLRIMDDRQHEPTGATDSGVTLGRGWATSVQPGSSSLIKCPIVLKPCVEPDIFAYNHLLT